MWVGVGVGVGVDFQAGVGVGVGVAEIWSTPQPCPPGPKMVKFSSFTRLTNIASENLRYLGSKSENAS